MENKLQTNKHVLWTTRSIRVDIETGEQIPKNTQEAYITISIKKKVKLNHNGTKGTIEYIRECKRNPQLKIKFDMDE